jgi:hypothetical protein
VFPAGSVARRGNPLSRLDRRRKRHVDVRVSGAVRRDLTGAEVGLALEKLARKVRAGRVRVEVEVERRRRGRVELALDAGPVPWGPRMVTAFRIGKFWRWFGPSSTSPRR